MTLGNLPDWATVTVSEISTSRAKGRIGLLSISETDWYEMVRQGHAPKGVRAMGKVVVWSVGTIRDIAERMAKGEFSNIKLYAKKGMAT